MYVLRVYLHGGAMIELLYSGKVDAIQASLVLGEAHRDNGVSLSDDYGKDLVTHRSEIAAWQLSDYDAELAGALEIARLKQQASDKHNQRVAAMHGLIGRPVPGMPGNGGIIQG